MTEKRTIEEIMTELHWCMSLVVNAANQAAAAFNEVHIALEGCLDSCNKLQSGIVVPFPSDCN